MAFIYVLEICNSAENLQVRSPDLDLYIWYNIPM